MRKLRLLGLGLLIACGTGAGIVRLRAAETSPGPTNDELLRIACRSNLHDAELITLEICERRLMVTEYTEEWRKIRWQDDLAGAFEQARRLDRPVLVFFYVKEYSQESSPFT